MRPACSRVPVLSHTWLLLTWAVTVGTLAGVLAAAAVPVIVVAMTAPAPSAATTNRVVVLLMHPSRVSETVVLDEQETNPRECAPYRGAISRHRLRRRGVRYPAPFDSV